MGKFVKKNITKENQISTKHVSVNLEPMSKKEYKMSSNSKEIIVKNFSLKISGGLIEINKKKHHSSNKTFNFEFKKKNSDFVLECCNATSVQDDRQEVQLVSISKSNPISMVKTLNVLINES